MRKVIAMFHEENENIQETAAVVTTTPAAAEAPAETPAAEAVEDQTS